MLSFVKKFIVFEKKNKNGTIKDEEINAISDEEAKEFLTKLPIESLIDLNRKIGEIYLSKKLLNQFDGFIACIGRPGSGKSSLCSAYYKIFYGIDKEIFPISNSTLCFRKGLWILKKEERQKIKQNIIKDIIDVEGFQVDDLSTWKYIMIVSLIATDIIIADGTTRPWLIVNKILGIIWYSLDKIDKLGFPKILKNIWIQIDDDEDQTQQRLEEILNYADNSLEKWKERGINLSPFLLETISYKDLRKVKGNILEIEDYLEQAKEAFEQILNSEKYESISTIIPHIDNFNNKINEKDTVNIKELIENDFNRCYSIVKNKKESQLLKDFSDKLTPPKTSNESLKEFINRHNIDLSFDQYKVYTIFYNCSSEYDEIYKKLIEEKDFQADPNIFKDQYNLLIEKVKLEENKQKEERSDIYDRYRQRQTEINNYFNHLKFYEYIDSYSSSKYNIDVNYQYENNLKNEYNDKIIDYYYKKKEEKKQQWQNQIDASKYKTPIQSYGFMGCVNGHKFSGNRVGCGSCKEKGIDFDDRLLYWVDVDERYGICRHCNVVRKISENIECGICGGRSICRIKFIDGYRP